jgi:hypothetical protein
MSNMNDDWVNDKALEAARMEAQVFGRPPASSINPRSGSGSGAGASIGGPNGEGETPSQTLRRLFEENSPAAAGQIIRLSNSASSEAVRFRAAAYIVERVLGPIGAGMNGGAGGGADAPVGSLEHTLHQIEQNMTEEQA